MSQFVGAKDEQQTKAVRQTYGEALRLLQQVHSRMQRASPGGGCQRGDEQQPVQRPLRPLSRLRVLRSGQNHHPRVIFLAFQQQWRDRFARERLADFAKHLVGLARELALEFEDLAQTRCPVIIISGANLASQAASLLSGGMTGGACSAIAEARLATLLAPKA